MAITQIKEVCYLWINKTKAQFSSMRRKNGEDSYIDQRDLTNSCLRYKYYLGTKTESKSDIEEGY